MAAPRSTSLRALRTLSQQNSPTLSSMAPFRRSLHITGAHSAQPVAGPDITSIYRARSLGDLRTECERRHLRSGGSKAELVDRLSNHDILQTRAFSIAMRRIDRQAFSSGSPRQTPSRHFNTSRSNKSVNDSSTVDFSYMPPLEEAESSTIISPRVPVLPDQYTHYERNAGASPAMKPEIYTVGDLGSNISGPSPMSEVVDNHAIDINPYDLTETVGRSRNAAEISKSPLHDGSVKGIVKDVWSGLLDDFRVPKQSTPRSRQ